MKKILLLLGFLFSILQSSAQTTITVFDTVLYYDGYASLVNIPTLPAGIIHHRNDLFARMLTTSELQSIGTTLQMNVTIKASCDNYDRIGNVNMALVPTGATTYTPDSVQRIELGRYITPFMNKNSMPDTVPYTYNIDNATLLMKDTGITNHYDIWIELELFGVPYAAQTQVAGCSGRNDVFYGTLKFVTNNAAPIQNTNVLIPLAFKKSFNNYQAAATDTIGKTTKTISFNIPNNLTDAAFFLITSNHGANTGGEEYNRRDHFVYFDNALMLTYKPGRPTCEPYRQYNTQSNGIYGATPRTNSQWQSFSNWCPGDVISIRRIDLGSVTAGNHNFMIRVPDAIFTGTQGNFPLSLYFQGKTSGVIAGINELSVDNSLFTVYPNPASEHVSIACNDDSQMNEITILNLVGEVVLNKKNPSVNTLTIDLADFSPGFYTLSIKTGSGNFARKLEIFR